MPEELIVKLEQEDIPSSWREIPANEATQDIGDEFLNITKPQYAALQVPSTISPRDKNYVINPNHPAMKEIFNKYEILDFEFDPRIFK